MEAWFALVLVGPLLMFQIDRLHLLRASFYASLCIALVAAVLPELPLAVETSGELQHISAFVVLSLLAWVSFPATPRWWSAALLCGFGALIEVVQAIPVLRRDPSLYDWAIDCATVTLSFTVLGAAGFVRRSIWPSPR